MKAYRYRGYEIRRTNLRGTAQEMRWYIPKIHSTGLKYSEEHCPKFTCLDGAKSWIDSEIQNERDLNPE